MFNDLRDFGSIISGRLIAIFSVTLPVLSRFIGI